MSPGVSLLAAIAEARGRASPPDLASAIGAGESTRWKINAAQMLVVSNTSREAAIDDAYQCGRIAATAALTAVHATAAAPLFARLTCQCPEAASDAARRALVEGVADAMHDAGAVLADAQVVDAQQLRFDVLVAAVVRPDRLRGERGGQPGDALVLAGPLGGGIYAAAHARGKLSADDRDHLIAHHTATNAVGIAFGSVRNVHAVASVGPEGLIGATLALARAAGTSATLAASDVPALARALPLAKSGCVSSGSSRNWNRDGASVRLDDAVMPETRALLTDPHTSGTLLVACKRESVGRVLKMCRERGSEAAEVGALGAVGEPRVVVGSRVG